MMINCLQNLLQSSPYLSAIEIENSERKKNKLKWINDKGFNSFIGVSTSEKNNIFNNYVFKTPSEPPVNYEFKSVNKKKWVSKSTFK